MTETRDSIVDIWGSRAPFVGDWPERVDERTVEEPERWVQSACVLCSNGCGLDIGIRDGRIVGVRGRAHDRVNRGRLGPKGLNGWEANNSADRLTRPLLRRDGEMHEVSWDEALDVLVERTRTVLEDYGPGAIGFYNTGQLFLEEYYTLALMAEAGIGTSHVDGNTRLCTATASTALIESFGTDGQPGSYTDFDVTDAIMNVGHNVAATQTVLWTRILDRLDGPNPPKLVVVDPRVTEAARRADVHLAPRPGTNLPLLNGLLHLMIRNDHLDHDFIDRHTVGFADLETITSTWSPDRVEAVTGVPAASLRAAEEIIGTAPTLVSTVLQGVYQSWQATASAVQVNNVHLVRGMVGRPGAAVFQMNGQPTAQNTRECGANGEMVAFRNWNNQAHMEDLARIWNVEPERIPHWAPPTHAMQIFRLAEMGSIRLLWIICTNPAVSLPQLGRIRDILDSDDVFVVVSDAFPNETTAHADLVLPAAIWGEKTGAFTNADRTVHISHKAVEPPGEARAELDVFVEFSRRMGFKDKDGEPLVKWTDAAGAFDAWRDCSRGQPCDYSGLSYEKLTGSAGIQWPCDELHPDGKERLYEDGVFNTAADRCETYGHDLATGAEITPEEYRKSDPNGRAKIKAADYAPPPEEPDEEYPFVLITGRVVHHFHTRTKTGRSAALDAAAPDVWVQLAAADAEAMGVSDGDMVEVRSRRGSVRGPARLGDIEPGNVFVPFHFGSADGRGNRRAANEMTITGWDAVSRQPYFKYSAVAVGKLG
jgi:ferredoxin-nitrate reductase